MGKVAYEISMSLDSFIAGARLIEDLRGKHIQLEMTEVIETKEAIHLRFRVIK